MTVDILTLRSARRRDNPAVLPGAPLAQSGGFDGLFAGILNFVSSVFSMDVVYSVVDMLQDLSTGTWILILFVVAALLFALRRD